MRDGQVEVEKNQYHYTIHHTLKLSPPKSSVGGLESRREDPGLEILDSIEQKRAGMTARCGCSLVPAVSEGEKAVMCDGKSRNT